MARGDPAARQHKLLSLLAGARYGMRLAELARELRCHERTVRRHLEALSHCGSVPIYSEIRNQSVYWKLDPAWRNAEPILLSPEEMKAVILAKKLIPRGNAVAKGLDSLLQKIKCQRPFEFRRWMDLVDRSILQGPGELLAGVDRIPHDAIIFEAIRRQRKIRFAYTDTMGKKTSRTAAPLFYNLSEGQLYLTAHCDLRNELRTFVPDRMERVEMTDEPIPDDVAPDGESHALAALGGFYAPPEEVELRILPWMRDYFTRNISHPSQQLFEKKGRHYLRFTIGVNWTLVWWIARFGPNVEVMKPRRLREQVREFLAEALEQYC